MNLIMLPWNLPIPLLPTANSASSISLIFPHGQMVIILETAEFTRKYLDKVTYSEERLKLFIESLESSVSRRILILVITHTHTHNAL